MKKLISLILAMLIISSSLPAMALNYGQEWANYTDNNSQVYSDVSPAHWAFDAVNRVSATDWFSGYPDGTFRPDVSITREEAMKVIVKFLGLQLKDTSTSSYHDVSATRWSSPYIEAGKLLFPKIETYNGQSPFQPEMPMKREDVMYALVIAKKYNNEVKFVDESVLNMFSDKNSISANLKPYVSLAVSIGLVAGKGGAIGAQDPLTRAEFATLLYRATYIGNGTGGGLEEIAAVESIELGTPLVSELTVGQKLTITANAKMTDGTVTDYSNNLSPYNSSNNNVVLMNKNEVTAVSAGTAVIKFNGESMLADKSLVINVKAPVVDNNATTEDEDEEDDRRQESSRDDEDEDEEDDRRQESSRDDEDEEDNRRQEATNNDDDDEEAEASLVSFSWSVDSLDLNKGETSKIKLIGTYSDGSTKDLTSKYSIYSSDEDVVEVSSNGKIEAVGEGTAKINMGGATLSSVRTARPLSVTVRAESRKEIVALEWSTDKIELSVGSTKTIKLYAVYSDDSKEDVTEECGIYAMDEDIAVVNGNEVKGLSKGETELWFESIPVAGIDLPEMLVVKVD